MTCGGFLSGGEFEPAPAIDAQIVRQLFEAKVFSMLRAKGLISIEIVEKLKSWKHTGFNAWIGPEIPDIEEIVRIGMYTVRAPAASGRLVLDAEPQLRYYAKGTRPDRDIGALFEPESRTFDYLDWIARLTSHIPDRGCQMTHYFAAYSNAHRGKQARCKSEPRPADSPAPTPGEPEEDWVKARRKSWARLIHRVYEIDPRLCECGATLKLIDVIESRTQSDVVGKILKHIKFVFDPLPLPARPPPSSYPEPSGAQEDGSLPDAYCF